MTTDNQVADTELDRQLELLGAYRQRRAPRVEATAGAMARELPARTDRRWAVLAVAAAAVVLFASGAALALRSGAGSGTGSVDAAGNREATGRGGDPQPSEGSDSDGDGIFLPPSRFTDSDASTPTDATIADDPTVETATTVIDSSADGADNSTTTSTSTPTASEPEQLDGVDKASAALSDSTTAMVELTAGLAGGADNSSGTTSNEERVADDLAAGVAQDHPDCATPTVNPDLSLTITLADCRAEDGRPMSGAITTRVTRWLPFEVQVVISELTVGADRLWMDATITYPAFGDPILRGTIATESNGDVTHIEGTARFRNGRTIVDAEVGWVADTSVIGGDRVTYRPGQTIVSATVSGLTVADGGCAPSSGTADWTVYTVTGIRGGGSETHDLAQLELAQNLSAAVTYRPNTPIDGLVELRVGTDRSDHQLRIGCR